MKKLLTLVLALAMTLSLAACGGDTTTTDDGSGETASGEPTKMTLILRGGAYGESLQAMLEPYPHLETVCGALQTGVYRPVIEEWTQFTNILGTEMDNIIQGTKTLDEALSYAQEQLEQLMAG